VTKKKEGEDPLPFSSTVEDGKRYVYLPSTIPDDKRENILPIIGKVISLCEDAGWETLETKRVCENSLWIALEAISDAITGVFYCLRKDGNSIIPQKNIPKAFVRGWDFALWYCFSSAAKVNDYHDGLSIQRVVNLMPADKGSWGGKLGKFTELDRITTLMRMLAQHSKDNIGPIHNFIKNKGYFVNKLVGKKPVKGIYLTEELTFLESEWSDRVASVEDKFSKLPKLFKEIPLGMTLTNLLSRLAVPLSKEYKIIEDAKSKRINDLLVVEGRGRTTRRVIAKGSDLPEKLIGINGGDSVRTIGKVLYSPHACANPQNAFISAVLAEVRSQNLREGRTFIQVIQDLDEQGKSSPNQRKILDDLPMISLAVQTYLEVLPDRVGSVSWDSAFGVFSKNK
jgi:hypothetical protein